jgi:hypothetical protein
MIFSSFAAFLARVEECPIFLVLLVYMGGRCCLVAFGLDGATLGCLDRRDLSKPNSFVLPVFSVVY